MSSLLKRGKVKEKAQEKSHESVEISQEEAFLGLLMGSVAIDGEISDVEGSELSAVVSRLTLFRKFNVREMEKMIAKIIVILQQDDLGSLFEKNAVKILTVEMRETLFAICVDLILYHGTMKTKEIKYLAQLQKALQIDNELGSKIVEVMLIKNRDPTCCA